MSQQAISAVERGERPVSEHLFDTILALDPEVDPDPDLVKAAREVGARRGPMVTKPRAPISAPQNPDD